MAASILKNVRELDIQVKHDFYDTSRQLFSIFSKRSREQIGILVPTVKKESFKVLSKAVKKAMLDIDVQDIHRKELFYNNAVAVVSSCEYKMRYLSSLLLKKNPEEKKVQSNFRKVKDMAMFFRDLWNRKYQYSQQKEKESKQRAKSIVTEPKWMLEQKREVVDTHRGQVYLESRQLRRFMDRYPNWSDEWILAETITVKKDYQNIDEDYDFFIASFDKGFFSPLINEDGKSDMVTKEIKRKFGIVCDIPNVVFWIVDIPENKN